MSDFYYPKNAFTWRRLCVEESRNKVHFYAPLDGVYLEEEDVASLYYRLGDWLFAKHEAIGGSRSSLADKDLSTRSNDANDTD